MNKEQYQAVRCVPRTEPPGVLRVGGRTKGSSAERGCKVKTNGIRDSPAFKFRVVLDALKAESKGAEAQVARACWEHPATLANGRSASKRRKHGEANEGPSCLVHCPSLITRNSSQVSLPIAHGVSCK